MPLLVKAKNNKMKLSAAVTTLLLAATLAVANSHPSSVFPAIRTGLEQTVYENVMAYHQTKSSDIASFVPQETKVVLDYLKEYFLTPRLKMKSAPEFIKSVACSSCVGGIDALLALHHAGLSGQVMANTAISLCKLVLDPDVCSGAVHNYMDEILFIADNDKSVDGGKFCALVMGGKCGKWEEVNSWTVPINPDVEKPEVVVPTLPSEESPTSKILHLTDIHLDLSYKVGTTTDCGKPMCCMNNTEMASDPTKAAGPWGNFHCDLPYWTFKDMLEQIRERHLNEIDYIMLTGDYPAHDVWAQSREGNLAHTKKVVDLISQVFPDKLILPGIGNHESFPCNSYPSTDVTDPQFAVNWLYHTLADYYTGWFPEEHQEAFASNFSEKGYYTMLIRPGFRVIVVNPNACLAYNFWLNHKWEDPSGVLAWLVERLFEAEAAGEKVHIINHIPPGNGDCLGAWGRNYAHIIERFESTVVAQFYGHTHNDEFVVFYDKETNSRPTNIGFVSSSATTYTGLNPAYTIYTIDGPYEGASLRVLDKEVYIFNLNAANNFGADVKPSYYKLFEAKKDLQMEALFPDDYDQLARRMANDDIFYDHYFRFYNHDSYGDDDSKRQVVCSMVTTSNIDDRKCNEIMGTK